MPKSIIRTLLWSYGLFFFYTSVIVGQTAETPVETVQDSVLSTPVLGSSDLKLFIQLIFSLAIVLILLIFTLWVLRYIMRIRFAGVPGETIKIISMRYIEPKKAIALVQVLDRVFIIGIAEQALTTLGELTLEEAGTIHFETERARQPFDSILTRFWSRGRESE